MKKPLLAAVVFYLFLVAIVFPYVRWFADNADTFQYLAITSKYISGDWSHAINGYWSPMISWLLVIPSLIFNDQITGFKILQVLIGLFTLLQWWSLLTRTELTNTWKNALLFVAIPFLIDYSLLNATPDLLFMGLLLMFLNRLIDGNIFSNKNAIKIGFTGAIMYFTKAFGFPFFLAMTFIMFLVDVKTKAENKFKWKNLLMLYGTFFLISSLWICILSLHVGHFTISEAARFNLSREAAPLPGRSAELPILGGGLIEPLPNSVSAWESPGDYLSKEIITPFNNPADYIQIIKRNLLSIYYFDFRHQAGFFFIVLLLLFLSLTGKKELFNKRWLTVCLLSVFILYAGYSLILVHSRYTWINNLLMILMTIYFMQTIFNKKIFKLFSNVVIIFILLLAVKRPLKEILFTSDKDYPVSWIFNSVRHPFVTLWVFYKTDFEMQRAVKNLNTENILNGNVASLKNSDSDRDPYARSLMILKNSGCRYFGQLDDKLNYSQQVDELNKMKINFLITWNNSEWGSVTPFFNDAMAGIRVYQIK